MHWDLGTRGADPMRMAEMASHLGYSGICSIAQYRGNEDLREFKARIKDAKRTFGVDVAFGIELAGGLKNVRRNCERVRGSAELIFVRGDYLVSRWAASAPVDFIVSPWLFEKGPGIDHIIAREAGENGVGVEFPLSSFIDNHGKIASRIIRSAMDCARVCKWAGVRVTVTSGARESYGMKGLWELAAFSSIIGAGEKSLSGKLVMENREKIAGKMIARGVRIV